ncbi:PH domain-containing protein [Staphylococcus sp. 17KM0847]|uniref:PH domain-containing protein n=1 Tax=Staphylococcus sp. 17KM0847 TaxID=2583989 RepID=UPI0015DC1B09|nr:PH domain-containing protein [Staphylococcus sp. 17KM0847]QLK86488.1 hypothetical protein FGL66_07190 [Staphylococcus sp. 17KM0847]
MMKGVLERSPETAKHYYRRYYGLVWIAITLPLILAITLIFKYVGWSSYLYILIAVIILLCIYCLLKPYFNYRYHRYRLTENVLEVQARFWFRKYEALKIERLQYVQWKNGPLMRRHKLQRLTLVTAGHEVVLPLLHKTDVVRIEQYCLSYLKEEDSDV